MSLIPCGIRWSNVPKVASTIPQSPPKRRTARKICKCLFLFSVSLTSGDIVIKIF